MNNAEAIEALTLKGDIQSLDGRRGLGLPDRRVVTMPDKHCADCFWHRMEEGDGDGLCVNKLSDFFDDRTDDDFKCGKWEAEDG